VSDEGNGLIPIEASLNYNTWDWDHSFVGDRGIVTRVPYPQQAELTVKYLVTDPSKAQQALKDAMDNQQGILPRVKKLDNKRAYAVEENPLMWLERRVNEMCKQGRKYGCL